VVEVVEAYFFHLTVKFQIKIKSSIKLIIFLNILIIFLSLPIGIPKTKRTHHLADFFSSSLLGTTETKKLRAQKVYAVIPNSNFYI
jgi:ABC-type microcin C transport system permease subunit YejB